MIHGGSRRRREKMAQREMQTGVVRESTDQELDTGSQDLQITKTADQEQGESSSQDYSRSTGTPQNTTADTQSQPTLGANMGLSTGVKVGALAIGAGVIISQL